MSDALPKSGFKRRLAIIGLLAALSIWTASFFMMLPNRRGF